MNEAVRNVLLSHVAHLDSEYLFFNPATQKNAVAFQHAFETARKLAGLEDFRLHDLRRTAATRMGTAGIDPYTIAAILGHSDIGQTATYAQATVESKRAAVAVLMESGPHGGTCVEDFRRKIRGFDIHVWERISRIWHSREVFGQAGLRAINAA